MLNWRTVCALGALACLGAVLSCANPFRDTYMSSLERWPHGEVTRLLPNQDPPQIVTSENMRRDAIRMMENGYLLLGRSRFRGSQMAPGPALKQAREIGASVVLIQAKYAESVTETVPMTEWIPDREVTYREVVEVQSGPDAGKRVEREVTKTIEGEFQTSYVPQTIEYYDYAATYWARSRPPIFGVLVQAMDEELRRQIQSNQGVVIKAVIGSSPAFEADLLRGDILTSMGGTPIVDPDQFFDLVISLAGQEVDVEFIRDGEKRSVPVPLKAE